MVENLDQQQHEGEQKQNNSPAANGNTKLPGQTAVPPGQQPNGG